MQLAIKYNTNYTSILKLGNLPIMLVHNRIRLTSIAHQFNLE